MKRIEVTVSIGDRRITLEGPEDFVREEVERFATLGDRRAIVEQPRAADGGAESEWALITEKKPRGHAETIAVLAQFLTSHGQQEFTPEQMRRAYIRAGVRPPKVIAQAIRDAKNLNDYIEPGSKKGTFRLSPHGERTVLFDLPRDKGQAES